MAEGHYGEFVKANIFLYLRSLYGGVPRAVNPGRDPLKFWAVPDVSRIEKWDVSLIRHFLQEDKERGRDTFSFVPDECLFRRIAADLGISEGHRVIHPYATDDSYARLLRGVGAKVDTYDLSVWSAIRSQARIGDAERLVDYTKGKYDHYFAFEPSSLFQSSAGLIRSIFAMASALKVADKVHILYHYRGSDATPVDFESVFLWLKKHFGADVHIHRYPVAEGTLAAATITMDARNREKLMDLARYLHRVVVQGVPKAYRRMVSLSDVISDVKAVTYDYPAQFIVKGTRSAFPDPSHADVALSRLRASRKGRTILRMLSDFPRVYYKLVQHHQKTYVKKNSP